MVPGYAAPACGLCPDPLLPACKPCPAFQAGVPERAGLPASLHPARSSGPSALSHPCCCPVCLTPQPNPCACSQVDVTEMLELNNLTATDTIPVGSFLKVGCRQG